ncbi:Protein YceI [Carnimonas sp. R-84981]|uniref:YceI family protein n=1 Tax=Carnimonas bestiolae TaxID=3402172 RepID=UPI003EDC1624
MKKLTASLISMLLVLPVAAQAAHYSANQDDSSLGFKTTYQGQSFDGTFGHWMASIDFDPAHLDTSKADVTVDLTSAKTGESTRDGMLPNKEFFDTEHHPKAHFVTTSFSKQGDKIVAEGTLEMKGHSEPVALTVDFAPDGNHATMDIHGKLKRLSFGVGEGDYQDTSVIGADVEVTAHLNLTAQ